MSGQGIHKSALADEQRQSAWSQVSGRDSFTAADVYVGSQIGWGMMYGSIERRPAFESYWQRIGHRPAALRAQEIDDALLRAASDATA